MQQLGWKMNSSDFHKRQFAGCVSVRGGQVNARHHHSVLLCNYRLMQWGQSERPKKKQQILICGILWRQFGGNGGSDVIGLSSYFWKFNFWRNLWLWLRLYWLAFDLCLIIGVYAKSQARGGQFRLSFFILTLKQKCWIDSRCVWRQCDINSF